MLTIDQIKRIAKSTYETKSRKFRIVQSAHYTMENYWDGGTRVYAQALDLATGRLSGACDASANPFNSIAHSTFEIPAGVGILCHSFFCGKDCGITLYVAPGCALASAPAPLVLARNPFSSQSTAAIDLVADR